MAERIRGWLNPILFSIFSIWVIITYLGFHPEHVEVLPDHPYGGFLLGFLLVIGLAAWWSNRQVGQKKKWKLNIRGSWLVGATVLLSLVMLLVFRAAIGLDRTPAGSAAIFFLFNSFYYLALLLLLSLGLFAIGKGVQQVLNKISDHELVLIALGCLVLSFLSTLLGLVGLLYGPVLGVVLLGAIVWQRKPVLSLLKKWFVEVHKWRIYYWWQVPVALVGLLLIGVYWLGSIKAFASGFDGAALYANMATLIADYHELPGAFQSYSWSLVMSWGQLLFGSLTMSIILSHMMFLPALALGYLIVRRWLKEPYALLAMVLVLSLPMVSFQTMVDEKVDLGLLFISLAMVEVLLSWSTKYLPSKWSLHELWQSQGSRILWVIGLLLGLCFTIKYTTVFLLVGVIAYLLWRIGGAFLFWGWMALFSGLIFLSGFHRMGNLPILELEAQWIGIGFSIVGVALLGFRYVRKPEQWSLSWKAVLPVGIGFLVAFAPWAGKNLAENNYQFSVASILYGQPDRVTLDIPGEYLSGHFNEAPSEVGEPQSFTRLTQGPEREKTEVDEEENRPTLAGNATREELQRYLGYEEGVWRYLSAPVDLSFGVNVPALRHQDIGFLFLLLLPFLFLQTSDRSWLRNAGVLLGAFFLLLAFYWTLGEKVDAAEQLQAVAAKLDSYWSLQGQTTENGFAALWKQVQQPLISLSAAFALVFKSIADISPLIFIPLLLLLSWPMTLLLRHRFVHWNNALQGVAVLLLAYTVFWILLGNTISWYAMLLWTFLPTIMVYYLQEPKHYLPGTSASLASVMLGVVVGIQLLLNVAIVFTSSQPQQANEQIYNWPMVEYASRSDLNQEKALGLFDPTSPQIIKILNREEDALIYRINTYLQFHIDKNDRRVFEDNQLQRFAEIINTVKEPENFLDVLKANQIRYILYDINSPSLDQTPEQSLRQKCITLLNLLLQSPKAELILTDNYVEVPGAQVVRLPNGVQAAAQPGLMGNTVYQGRVALFRIK
ncbi:MAG: hypothetical protein AAFZ63_11945 [Bacteroidota bacterium]